MAERTEPAERTERTEPAKRTERTERAIEQTDPTERTDLTIGRDLTPEAKGDSSLGVSGRKLIRSFALEESHGSMLCLHSDIHLQPESIGGYVTH